MKILKFDEFTNDVNENFTRDQVLEMIIRDIEYMKTHHDCLPILFIYDSKSDDYKDIVDFLKQSDYIDCFNNKPTIVGRNKILFIENINELDEETFAELTDPSISRLIASIEYSKLNDISKYMPIPVLMRRFQSFNLNK